MKVLVKLIALGGVVLLSGCMVDKASMTADERVEQESRMRRFLNDSSPRNMNEEPKVTPEINHRFVIPKDSKKAPDSEEFADMAAQSRD